MNDNISTLIRSFNSDHTWQLVDKDRDCLFVARLRTTGLDESQIATVISIMEATCNNCWDADAGCKCDPGFDE